MTTQIVTIALILAMSVTTFTTQRQLTMKNMPKAALEGPIAQQQKVLLYVMPLIFAFSGVNFPIGVLIYWTVTNLWSMGQQFYSIRRMPAPGSEAERLLKERQARKAAQQGAAVAVIEGKPVIEEKPRPGQRQQPVRKDRQKPKTTAGGAGADEPNADATETGARLGKAVEDSEAPRTSAATSGGQGGSSGGSKSGVGGVAGLSAKAPAKKKRTGPDSGTAGSEQSA